MEIYIHMTCSSLYFTNVLKKLCIFGLLFGGDLRSLICPRIPVYLTVAHNTHIMLNLRYKCWLFFHPDWSRDCNMPLWFIDLFDHPHKLLVLGSGYIALYIYIIDSYMCITWFSPEQDTVSICRFYGISKCSMKL